MSQKAVKVVAVVVLVVALVAAAAGISYYLQQRKIDQIEQELATRPRQELPARRFGDTTEAPTPAPAKPATPKTEKPAQDATPEKDKEFTQFAFVGGGSSSGGTVTIKLDYADFLSGDDAAAAAAAAGGESPPPNDYYISNTNPKLRTFKIAKNAKIQVAYTTPEETEKLTPAQFLDAITNNTEGAADAGYWFVIKGDTILGGEEQWTP